MQAEHKNVMRWSQVSHKKCTYSLSYYVGIFVGRRSRRARRTHSAWCKQMENKK